MTPINFKWDGETMQPVSPRDAKACDDVFVIGERYALAPVESRSTASHNHYFACIKDGWDNLPDSELERFPSTEHLRKFALIKSGYANQTQHVASSKVEAIRLAAFIRPMDTYAIVIATNCVVTVYTAQSQSIKAMGKKVFQESKDAVLSFIASLIGAKATDLGQAA